MSLIGCKDSKDTGIDASGKLNLTWKIASQIEQAHKIKSHPYYRIAEDAGQIKLHLSDPQLDHQSLVTEISKLKSVQSFDGKLYVVFRYPEDDTVTPTMWVKYDAKAGGKVEP